MKNLVDFNLNKMQYLAITAMFLIWFLFILIVAMDPSKTINLN